MQTGFTGTMTNTVSSRTQSRPHFSSHLHSSAKAVSLSVPAIRHPAGHKTPDGQQERRRGAEQERLTL
ncbi:uncharacterized [Tachysurus ichikawai]